jgi:Spy/CpxP family protein refolding chaperone
MAITNMHRGVVGILAIAVLGMANGLRAAKDAEPDVTKVPPPSKLVNIRWVLESNVQQDLKLTKEQQKKIVAVLDEVRRKHRGDLQKARVAEAMNQFDVAKELDWKVYQAEREALITGVPGILTPGQMKRYQQIEWHLRGLHHAFLDEAVQKQLNFTQEQRKHIRRIRDEVRAEAMRLLPGPVIDQALLEATEQKFLPAALGKFLDVLTGPQKTTWKELTGEPFQFPAVAPPPK